MNKAEDRKFMKFVAGVIAAWFAVVLSASVLHLFRTGPDVPPFPIGLAVLIPVALFSVWFAASSRFREFAFALNTRTLTMVQAWRIGGFLFLVLYTYHILPGIFALPAGWGDMAIGATAPIVAMTLAKSKRKISFMLWHLLGMADLLMAVSLGAAAAFIDPHGIPTSAMTALPLSLIPTFAVPLLMILHIICIAQARRWPERPYRNISEQAPASAA
jgi:hypothetical protein